MPGETVVRTVSPDESPRRLDSFITGALDGVARAEVQRWIRDGRVSLNGVTAHRPSRAIAAGDRVEIGLPEPVPDGPVARPIDFDAVHVDADLIIVDKPAGLAVHPGAGHRDDTLVNGILARWPEVAGVGEPLRPGIVHRLDRDTSGLLLVARSAAAHRGLSRAVRARRVTRRYTALVWGHLAPDEGIIDAPVKRDPRRPRRQAVDAGGRPARTRYRVLRRLPSTTLLQLTLETGRTHQIRVHLAAISFPVVGDRTYGRAGFGLSRQFLHASYLALDHPVTGQRLEATSPLPPDLASALERAAGAGATV